MISDNSFTRPGFVSYIRPRLHYVQPGFEAVHVSVWNTCTFTVFSLWCEYIKGHFLKSHLQKAENLFQLLCAACFLFIFLWCLTFNVSIQYFVRLLFNVNDSWWCKTVISVCRTYGLACPWVICSLLLVFFLFVSMFVLILATYP